MDWRVVVGVVIGLALAIGRDALSAGFQCPDCGRRTCRRCGHGIGRRCC